MDCNVKGASVEWTLLMYLLLMFVFLSIFILPLGICPPEAVVNSMYIAFLFYTTYWYINCACAYLIFDSIDFSFI